jgi:hypothetical protein
MTRKVERLEADVDRLAAAAAEKEEALFNARAQVFFFF